MEGQHDGGYRNGNNTPETPEVEILGPDEIGGPIEADLEIRELTSHEDIEIMMEDNAEELAKVEEMAKQLPKIQQASSDGYAGLDDLMEDADTAVPDENSAKGKAVGIVKSIVPKKFGARRKLLRMMEGTADPADRTDYIIGRYKGQVAVLEDEIEFYEKYIAHLEMVVGQVNSKIISLKKYCDENPDLAPSYANLLASLLTQSKAFTGQLTNLKMQAMAKPHAVQTLKAQIPALSTVMHGAVASIKGAESINQAAASQQALIGVIGGMMELSAEKTQQAVEASIDAAGRMVVSPKALLAAEKIQNDTVRIVEDKIQKRDRLASQAIAALMGPDGAPAGPKTLNFRGVNDPTQGSENLEEDEQE